MRTIQEVKSTGAAFEALNCALEKFTTSIADDLNISPALAALYDMIREINTLADEGKIGTDDAQNVLALMQRFNTVLGVISFEKAEEEIPQDVQQALERRIEARKNREWQVADELRDFIHSKGFVIEDTPAGAVVKRGE